MTHVGHVKWFNESKGYGFIIPDSGGDDVFFHVSLLEKAGIEILHEGDRVQFELRVNETTKKKSATVIQRL